MAQPSVARWWEREAFAIGLGVVFLALLFSPRNAAALTSLLGAYAFVVLLAGLRFGRARLPERATAVVLGVAAAPVAWLVVTALFAADRRVSLVGNLGQHQGALTWVAALLALAAVVVTRVPGDAGRAVRAVAIYGAALAATALLDAAGLMRSATFSPEASGIVENSISLSQALVIALGCALAWWLGRRGRPESWGAVAAAVLLLGGLVVAQSIAAWLGIVLAALSVGAGWALSRGGRPVSPKVWGVLAASLSVAGVAVIWLALRNGVGSGIERTLANMSNDRFTIWTSAVAASARNLAFGRGPEQFSAWVTWNLQTQGAVTTNAAYDPHNLWLYFLIGGGLIGLALAIAAAAVLVAQLAARPSAPAVAGLAGLVAFGVATMFGWASPLSLLVAAIVTGALLPASFEPRSRAADATVGALGLVAVALAVVIVAWGGSAEYAWAGDVGVGAITTDKLVELAQQTGDPSLASQALSNAFGQPAQGPESIVAATKGVLPQLESASDWHVDAAFSRFQLAAIGGKAGDDASWKRVQTALADGKKADPASGLWDTLGALQAASWGRSDDASAYAKRALTEPLPEQARLTLQSIGP